MSGTQLKLSVLNRVKAKEKLDQSSMYRCRSNLNQHEAVKGQKALDSIWRYLTCPREQPATLRLRGYQILTSLSKGREKQRT
jgi:hypothetical protein